MSEILTLDGKEGNNHDKLTSRLLLSLAMFFENFHIFYGTPSGTEGPSLVKLPVEEAWFSHSLCSLYLLDVLLNMFWLRSSKLVY